MERSQHAETETALVSRDPGASQHGPTAHERRSGINLRAVGPASSGEPSGDEVRSIEMAGLKALVTAWNLLRGEDFYR